MNRTTLFLGLAAALTLLALVVGMPHVPPTSTSIPTPTPPSPPAAVVASGTVRMEGRLSHPFVVPGQSDLFVTVDLTGVQVEGAQRMPVNLAVVIDRSGSMSGQKLQQAKKAARQLVRQLQESDRLAIVHYGSDVKVLPGIVATAQGRERMADYIDGIWDEGGTNIGAGLVAARSQLLPSAAEYRVNRIILISDGQPTEGLTDDRDLTGLVKEIRREGITVSAIGVGTDFNEDLMQTFAEYGSGSYGYLQDAARLAALFEKDLMQAATTIARNVELSFELPAGVEMGEVFGYPWTQAGRTVRVPLPDFSSGQRERLVARLTVRAGEVGKTVDVAGLRLSYRDLVQNGQGQSDAHLSAMVTDRREEVLAHADKQVAVHAARARSASNVRQAAISLQKGDRAEARKYLEANQVLFEQAAQVAGPAAVQADMAEQQEVLDGMANASSEEEINHQVKNAKRKALIQSGRMGSVY